MISESKVTEALRCLANNEIEPDYIELGYEPYNFGYFGKPERDDIVSRCIEIIVEAIVNNGR